MCRLLSLLIETAVGITCACPARAGSGSARLSQVASQINIPAPVGMICAGLFLENVPNKGANQAILIWGLKPSWSTEIRAAALAIIFLRSGLEIDLAVRVSHHPPAQSLITGPIAEAFSTCKAACSKTLLARTPSALHQSLPRSQLC